MRKFYGGRKEFEDKYGISNIISRFTTVVTACVKLQTEIYTASDINADINVVNIM